MAYNDGDNSWFEWQAILEDYRSWMAMRGDDLKGGEPPPADWPPSEVETKEAERVVLEEAVIDVRPHIRSGHPVRGYQRVLPDIHPVDIQSDENDYILRQWATRAADFIDSPLEFEDHTEKMQNIQMVKRQNVLDVLKFMEHDPALKSLPPPGGLFNSSTASIADFINERQLGWAETSSDKAFPQIALQFAVAEEFGIDPTIINDSLSDAQHAHVSNFVWRLTQEDVKKNAAEFYATNQVLLHSYAAAVYQNTQSKLKAAGITEVILYRGMFDPNRGGIGALGPGPQMVAMNPLSSWSLDEGIARRFSGDYGVILSAIVPVERVWSTARTGPGCLDEQEFLVLGGKKERVNVTVLGPEQMTPEFKAALGSVD